MTTTWVYRCWNASGSLLYIGMTKDVARRTYHHMHSSEPSSVALAKHVASITAWPYSTREAALAAEKAAIRALCPPLNRHHNVQHLRTRSVVQASP